MSKETAADVARGAGDAAMTKPGNPAQDRTPANEADGLNEAVATLLGSRGLSRSKGGAASADGKPGDQDEALSNPNPEAADGEPAPESPSDAEPEGEEGEGQPDDADAAAEATEDAEPEGEVEGEEDDGADKGPKGFQKRIDKLTAKRREAEAAAEAERKRADELAAELAQLKAGKAPDQTQVSADDAQVKSMTETIGRCDQEIAVAQRLRAMVATDAEQVANVVRKLAPDLPNYEADTLRDWLNDYLSEARVQKGRAEGALRQRKEQLAEQTRVRRGQIDALATEHHPWLKDEKDARTVQFRQFMERPEVKGSPDAAWFIAAGIEKLLAIQARAKVQAKGAAKPAAKPTVKPSAGGGGAPAKAATATPVQAARQGLASGGLKGASDYVRAAVAESLRQ